MVVITISVATKDDVM